MSSSLKSCDLVSHTLRLQPLKCHINSLFSSSSSPTVALSLDVCCVSAAFAFCFLAYLLTILQQPCLPSPLSPTKETCDFVSFLRQNVIERISIELASIEKKEMEWSMLKYLLSLFSVVLMDMSKQGQTFKRILLTSFLLICLSSKNCFFFLKLPFTMFWVFLDSDGCSF